MPSSFKILRGLDIKGWKTYEPRVKTVEQAPPYDDEPARRQEIKEEREILLQAARTEAVQLAEQLAAKARQEAGELQKKAYEKGYEEGYRKGEKEGLKLTEKGRRLLLEAQVMRQRILDGAEKEIIQVAVSLAEKLLNYQVKVDSRGILSVISRALEALPPGQEIFLHVNPQDEKACRENRETLKEQLNKEIHLEIVTDPEIPRGGCRLETEAAEVEVLLKKELEILAGKLLELAEQETGDKKQGISKKG